MSSKIQKYKQYFIPAPCNNIPQNILTSPSTRRLEINVSSIKSFEVTTTSEIPTDPNSKSNLLKKSQCIQVDTTKSIAENENNNILNKVSSYSYSTILMDFNNLMDLLKRFVLEKPCEKCGRGTIYLKVCKFQHDSL